MNSHQKDHSQSRLRSDYDGWYISAGQKVIDPLKIYFKYDVFRTEKDFANSTDRFFAAANYEFYNSIVLQFTYYYTHNKSKDVSSFNSYNFALMYMF